MARPPSKAKIAEQMEWEASVRNTKLESDYPPPVWIKPTPGLRIVNGYTFTLMNGLEGRVDLAWRDGNLYGFGYHIDPEHGRGTRSASQIGFTIYATERDAYIALRLAIEDKVRKALQAIDQKISEFS